MKKMDGEDKKSASKKRLKRAGIGFDSDDDEPIGSIFKLKKIRISKKLSSGVEGSGQRSKNGEPTEKKDSCAEEDSGGMDDTLANFRKRLKGSRIDNGSGSTRGRNSKLNVVECSYNGHVGDRILLEKSTLNVRDEGLNSGTTLSSGDGLKHSPNKSGDSRTTVHCDEETDDPLTLPGVRGEPFGFTEGKSEKSLIISSRQKSDHVLTTTTSSVRHDNVFAVGTEISMSCNVESSSNQSESMLKEDNQFASDQCHCTHRLLSKSSSDLLKDEGQVMSNEDSMRHNEAYKSKSAFPSNHLSKPSKVSLSLNENGTSIHKCTSISHGNHHSGDALKGISFQNDDQFFEKADGSGISPASHPPDESQSCHEDVVSVTEFGNRYERLSTIQDTAQKAKNCRHGEMTNEGDTDWDRLTNEQAFLESQCAVDDDQQLSTRIKIVSSSNLIEGAENYDAAAVSAGLKPHVAGPLEKIRFKDILKRKGGLQEYLECRNQILCIWSKDVTRILPLADCGVSDVPSLNETPRASLIRELYVFLDQCGYINTGIASHKDRASSNVKYKVVKDDKFVESSGVSVADSEDGVSFIVGHEKSLDISLKVKDCLSVNDGTRTLEATEGSKGYIRSLFESANMTKHAEGQVNNHQENGSIEAQSKGGVYMGIRDSVTSCKMSDCRETPVITSEPRIKSSSMTFASNDCMVEKHHLLCDAETAKKVLVIGAGPAGLTAARHLHRQGFSVTVLEARNRIGGRVFTDHSSLSVPVDLGASIITGVEADVATERRPDPSSLICAQLGLELTVLNSDCPLYDIVTGEKVPADLDEALEAEYNRLLDDTVLLVAQKGEYAMKMSLEDGLEYSLKRRRMSRSGRNLGEAEVNCSVDASWNPKKGSTESKYFAEEILSPLERRVMDWHFANLEYGCAALLKEVSLPYWNQDDIYGGFGGAHCMIKGGYSTVLESLGEGLAIHLNHVVSNVSYGTLESVGDDGKSHKVKVSTTNGSEFRGDAVLITVPLGCLKAQTIEFSPPLPQWKHSSIRRLGFGVLNKVVLEFPEVFWDDTVDYFGATAEETDRRGHCFMFWNVKKTVGAPVLIALVVGKAALDSESLSSYDHVNRALAVLHKLFGEESVPDPVASVVTDWGRDPFSYGAYSYVAIGASGEDYDILGRPVDNCLFFAGEATCKEHPDTVGGAMMSGLREAVRIIDILSTGNDYMAEVEAMEASQRHTDFERDEVRDIVTRIEAVEFSNAQYTDSLDGSQILTREALLQDMFFNAKTNAGRLHLAKELLNLPVELLKSFAGTKEGLTTLNSWMLDSMGKDGTQLLRHCVRLLVLVSTDLLAVRVSGIGKTVKEKVCVHTSRDIRAIASQLVSVWLEVFRREKASNNGYKLSRQATSLDLSKRKSLKDSSSGKPPLHAHVVPASGESSSPSTANVKRLNGKQGRQQSANESKLGVNSLSQGCTSKVATEEEDSYSTVPEEEKTAFAAEAARAKALAAAKAYASSEGRCSLPMQLPKIPSFHKFARREHCARNDECDSRRKWSGGILGMQDCISEIDSRNCRVRNWSVDFSAAYINLESSRMSVDNLSQRSHSNEIASHLNLREHSGESVAEDSNIYTKAWIDTAGGVGIKDHHAIERWQSQAAAADPEFYHLSMHLKDEEDSNACSNLPSSKLDGMANESSISHVTVSNKASKIHPRGADRIKQAVVDYVSSLLMPLYKSKKLDKDGYKAIMKKSATKVMEQATDAEKAMAVHEFLDFKRRNKIRSFVDKLIERHMSAKPDAKSSWS